MEASQKITEYIQKYPDWKGDLIQQIRNLITRIEPAIQEEWKWGSPVWSLNGMICSIGAFKKHVSLTFFKGAEIENKTKLFDSPSDSKNTRSVIWKEGDELYPESLSALIKLAIRHNEQNKPVS